MCLSIIIRANLPDLEVSKGKNFYEEYLVEQSLLCPDAKLIAVKIYNDGELAKKLLEKLIEHYLPSAEKISETEVMLFLHRKNDFNEKDVFLFF